MPQKLILVLKVVIVLIELYVGFTAVMGGYKLISTNGMGMPLTLLARSPFTSFFWPGIILAVIVGGTQLIAALFWIAKDKIAPELATIAGFGLLIWLFTEVYLIGEAHFLQAVYFTLGILSLVITFCLVRFPKKLS
ncbi:MAG: hypothetical protein M1607_02970 [Patescibacteria group bacterium]|nr:hypothetical protein [Patescibacteria group bacterium]